MFSPISVAKSPADRPGGASTGFGRPHQRAPAGDRVLARDRRDHDGARGDEVDELAEERLVAVFAVVLLGGLARDREQLHLLDREALGLDAAKDLADEPAGDAVGFDDEQGGFDGHGR